MLNNYANCCQDPHQSKTTEVCQIKEHINICEWLQFTRNSKNNTKNSFLLSDWFLTVIGKVQLMIRIDAHL